jgi:GT2 family glycosyltransferase
LKQTHRETEIIIVVDGNEELHKKIVAGYGSNEAIKAVLLKQNMGLCAARNAGIRAAQGNAIAFLDDDAVAERTWVENLVDTYEKFDAISVGGKVLPIWVSGKPDYLPEELYWLVAITHEGFAEEKAIEVRNTFGPNMSFKQEVFEKIGVFNQDFGFAKRGISYIQAEEAEFSLRMKQKLGKGVMYNPEAIVYHKIPPSKVKMKMLLKRAFYQGYSKALLRKLNPSADPIATERSYLKSLLLKYIPRRIKRIYYVSELKKLSILVASITSVGLGFVYGYIKGIKVEP